jgi:hypothetical protein
MRPRVFFVCTGAGAGIQHRVWSTPGCSEYFAGAAFPYSKQETDDFLGFAPQSYCSTEAAIQLAMAAYMRAWNWPDKRAIGVAITASVASLTEHRGDHRIHVAAVSEAGCWTHTYILTKATGALERQVDGAMADELASAFWGIAENQEREPDATELARKLFFEHPLFLPTGERRTKLAPTGPLFPGAFNPPHIAHTEPAERYGATFWVDATHPHKSALSLSDLLRRAKLLKGRARYFTECAPLYIDKARRFESTTFLIGTDALKRMLDPKWGPEVLPMLFEFSSIGTRFLVLERDQDTTFDLLLNAGVPVQLQSMFSTIGAGYDVSSTALREAAGL